MKKIYFVSFTFFIAVALFSACNKVQELKDIKGSGNVKTEPRSLSGFKEIKAANAVNLEITVQKDFAVTVEADDNLLPYVTTEVSGGVLKISTDDIISTKTKVNVKISMPELTDLDVSGASTANITGTKTDSLKLNASGASKIKIDGEVKSVEAIASGASGIDAEKLKTENARTDASGASTITVSPNGNLEANASGASGVIYTSDPKNIKQNSSDVSSIIKK